MMASVMSVMPGQPLITKDQINLLGVDNVVSDAAIKEKRDFTAFDIAPVPMSAILPTYMWRFRKRGQFDRHVSEGTTV
jgi:NADH dehydrogenase